MLGQSGSGTKTAPFPALMVRPSVRRVIGAYGRSVRWRSCSERRGVPYSSCVIALQATVVAGLAVGWIWENSTTAPPVRAGLVVWGFRCHTSLLSLKLA